MNRGISLALSLAMVVAFAGVVMADREKSKKDASSKSRPEAKCPVTGKKISKDASIDYKGGKLSVLPVALTRRISQYEERPTSSWWPPGRLRCDVP